MIRGQLQIGDDLVVDARRAVWLPDEQVLVVADLHLGYAWAHRASGQLMPIIAKENTLARLQELARDYSPREFVALGDIVHRAVAVPVLEQQLRQMIDDLSATQMTLITGNHDRDLEKLVRQWRLPVELAPCRQIGRNLLVHGDSAVAPESGGRVIMGHEHPAITIGDGVTTSQKCPCFLVSDTVVVLPAFSPWAAGTNIRAYPFMSELAREARFTKAVAICGEKLLPIPL